MSRQVLVPVDGSEESDAAVAFAREHLSPDRVVLVHAVDPVHMMGYGDGGYFDFESYRMEGERRRDKGEQLLERYRQDLESAGVEVETVLKVGHPEREIVEVITDREVDHVVMGSRGRSGVGRVLFGSVAEAVTRRSPVPVTIVR